MHGLRSSFTQSLASFTYDEEVQVTLLNPDFGTVHGATEVLVHAKHLVNTTGLVCKFGNVVVPATYLSAHRLTCSSPPHGVKVVRRRSDAKQRFQPCSKLPH